MQVLPLTAATGSNRSDKQVSVNAWNAGHKIVAADTIADIEALSTESRKLAHLGASGREGVFQFSASDLSAEVAADTAQGIYIAPSGTSGASGAWVRQFAGPLVFDWFGAVPGDYVDGIGEDCFAAWQAMHAFLLATKRNSFQSTSAAGPEILFPGAQYYFSDTLSLKLTLRLTGMGMGGQTGWPTVLYFASGKAGIITNESYTLGNAQDSPATTSAHGTIIDGFNIISAGGAISGVFLTDLLYSGIRCRTRTTVRNCRISNFRGVGICNSAAVGDGSDPFHGNVNGWITENVRIEGCRTGGHLVSGGDANGGRATSVDVNACGRFGIYDESFLSNTYVACQADGCGLMSNTGTTQTGTVYHGGNFYYLRVGVSHATAIATTPGTDSSVWLLYGSAGAATANFPQWSTTPTETYVPSGGYGHTGASNTSTFNSCYYETGQAPPQIGVAGIVLNGFMSNGLSDGGSHLRGTGAGLASNRPYVVVGTHADTPYARLGGDTSLSALPVLQWGSATASPFNPSLESTLYNDGATGDLIWNSYGLRSPARFTGYSTTRTYGGRAQADCRYTTEVDRLALGDGGGAGNNCRVVVYGTAAPVADFHARGEIVFNSTPSASNPMGWMCVTAGTPGTWKAMANLAA